jgi:hypothetical protein
MNGSLTSSRLVAFVAIVSAFAPVVRGDDIEFFENKIRPLLIEHCYSCHSADAKKLKGNLLLDTREGVLKGGEAGPVLVAGDLGKSRLITAVRYTDSELQMPPDKKLSDEQIADLEAWVKMGAPDPRRGTSVAVPSEKGGINLAAGKQWWAFQPVHNSPPPVVKNADWARKDLDRFILAKLEEKNLSPAPQADKRTLIRRAYYDLIGLPPTLAEVDTFVADGSPDAFAKVVDHLLALPQYGERWGRHWLDVVRYTDSFDGRILGGAVDSAFAYRYRDWVVDALNSDLPYDRFVKSQIAGDLQPGPKPGTMDKAGLVATSVYFLGEWGGGDADKEKLVTDIVDDQVDLTGRAFLGMTVACARCHDHKFDPISTQDYYGLAGIFFSSHVLADPGPKGGSPNNLRVPLADKSEIDQRAADEKRVAELGTQTEAMLDEQYAKLAKEMLPKVDEYLAAAWEYENTPAASRPAVLAFAQQRNLHAYILSQWLNYVGTPKLKLFPKPAATIGNFAGVSGWRNADDADTPVVWANAMDKPADLLPGLTLQAKSISVHPSPTAGVAIAWKSPMAGRVKVTGTVTDGHSVCGDGIAWSISRLGGKAAGELASGTISNGGKQTFSEGTGGSHLEAIEVAAGDMIQLAILPKADHSCDTTGVEFVISEAGGSGKTWNLVNDVSPSLTQANPHADSFGNSGVWYFHDMAGQSQSVFAAGSAMSAFTASISASAGTDGGLVRAAAAEVRKALQSVAGEFDQLKAAGKDPAALMTPDASFYHTLTAPRGSFWIAARNDDSNLPADARPKLASMRGEMSTLKQSLAVPIPLTHAMVEGGTPTSMFPGIQDVPVHIRGSYTRLGEVVPRRFPQVVAGEKQEPIKQGSGRKELADWIASPTNPLTARVMANRIWQGHFGEGIVRTANNFGKLGEPPTHPELLDHLATRLIDLKWSMKAFHRELMLSTTYQQASNGAPETMKADPGNLLVGRMNRRRLDAEGLRDSLLALNGRLDKTMGGVSINDMNTTRRTLYVTTVRSDRATYRNLFDAADSTAIVEKRIDSTVAPQALFLLNSQFALDQSKLLAARVMKEVTGDDSAKVDWLYRSLFARPPASEELEIAATAFKNAANEKMSPETAWEAYCQVLLCSNEFMYVD